MNEEIIRKVWRLYQNAIFEVGGVKRDSINTFMVIAQRENYPKSKSGKFKITGSH